MSKRLSLSLSSNQSRISTSPKPSIFASLLANKTNENLKSTQKNNSASSSGSRHPTSPKKLFNLDSEIDEIDLVNYTAEDYVFSNTSAPTTNFQLKKNLTKNNKTTKQRNVHEEKTNEPPIQTSSNSGSPTKSQQPGPLLSTPPSSPIKMRKLESSSSESFDEFDDTVKAKILESSDSEVDFDSPTTTSRVSNKGHENVESIESSPINSKQIRSPVKSQVSSTSTPSQQTKQASRRTSTNEKLEVAEDTSHKSVSNEEVNDGASKGAEQQSEKKDKPASTATATQTKEVTSAPSVPNLASRRLLQVAFDSPAQPAKEESKPKTTSEERPKSFSLFKNTPILLNSDDDFVPASQPVVTKPVSHWFFI